MNETVKNVILTTERLQLHYIDESQYPSVERLVTNPSVMKYVLRGPIEQNKFTDFIELNFAKQPSKIGLGCLYTKESGVLAGIAGLHFLEIGGKAEVELGFIIDSSFQGCGYGTEIGHGIINLAKTMNFSKIYATVHPDNSASIGVIESKLHFTISWEKLELNRGPRLLYSKILEPIH